MPVARIMVQETGATTWSTHNGDYSSREAAVEEGGRLLQVGSVQKFQVWVLDCAFERTITMEPIDVG